MAGGQHYVLRWNNYQTNMTSVFHQLLENEAFVDVTLACNDLSLKAHKVVLSACSSYFQKLLMENPCKHPTIIMPQDVCYADLKFIIEFVYKGEIDVSQAELQSLLKTADQLKIKGLCDTPDESHQHYNYRHPHHFHHHHHHHHHNGGITGENTTPNLVFGAGGGGGAGEHPKIRRLSSPKHQRSADNCESKKKCKKNNSNAKESTATDAPIPSSSTATSGGGTTATTTTAGGGESHEAAGSSASTPPAAGVATEHGDDGRGQERTLTSECDDDERSRKRLTTEQNILNMSSNALLTGQLLFSQFGEDFSPDPPAPMAIPVGHVDMHDHSPTRTLLTNSSLHRTDLSNIDSHMSGHSMDSHDGHDPNHTTMLITPELTSLMPLGTVSDSSIKSEDQSENSQHRQNCVPKSWTQEDMERALDALRTHHMSLTKASSTYGIPSTTLWQRAHRLGIDTPKKEGPTKSWTEESLNSALDALRTGTISANKASKAYGIPSSTLYKIARREGIRLATPFNATPTTWTPEDLEKALESIRSGHTSVQRASTEFGIPTGTLYGRCKREGIELSRSNPAPWSEGAMNEALEAVRLGHMSINQAAIHYNLPYSSLYGRFKRGVKCESDVNDVNVDSHSLPSMMIDYSTSPAVQYQNHTNS